MVRPTEAWRIGGSLSSGFSPKEFYGGMMNSLAMQVARDEVAWADRHRMPDTPVDTLLAFGCAVQHTPHLMRAAVRVFEVLGIEHQAVVGRQFCCGRPFQRIGKVKAADNIVGSSYARFASYRPQTMVQWCGACMITYIDVASRRMAAPFEVIHVSTYMARVLRERAGSLPWREHDRLPVLVHRHVQPKVPNDRSSVNSGKPGRDQVTDATIEAVDEILSHIPGVQNLGIVEPPSTGAPCDLKKVNDRFVGLGDISSDAHRTILRDLAEQADRTGAEIVVTPYHACQKQWSKLASHKLGVRHWMSVLADALGVGVEDRFQAYWRLADPEAIVRLSRPAWSSWGISPEDAYEHARTHFTAAFSESIHDCECGGSGCGAPVPELVWPLADQVS
ncbi:MAG: heterodisulfide reductase-related iron-sulfur binding cluster [bacterium]|nr:heterodisulfide reductase-related iron-sulfur binding cluster [bacterium]MDE0290428.1 heterodisulfide reductase-related iron-sulfur binding cluster [bacterium]MDE0437809.1 heterodisulfide reductase-related iron-sulfur binding cluster [bacterium]